MDDAEDRGVAADAERGVNVATVVKPGARPSSRTP